MDNRLEGIPTILRAIESVIAELRTGALPGHEEKIATLEELRRRLRAAQDGSAAQ